VSLNTIQHCSILFKQSEFGDLHLLDNDIYELYFVSTATPIHGKENSENTETDDIQATPGLQFSNTDIASAFSSNFHVFSPFHSTRPIKSIHFSGSVRKSVMRRSVGQHKFQRRQEHLQRGINQRNNAIAERRQNLVHHD
jgi:hypothetical protein